MTLDTITREIQAQENTRAIRAHADKAAERARIARDLAALLAEPGGPILPLCPSDPCQGCENCEPEPLAGPCWYCGAVTTRQDHHGEPSCCASHDEPA